MVSSSCLFLHFLGNSSTPKKPGRRPKTAAKRKKEEKKEKRKKKALSGRTVYHPNFDLCTCMSKKVVKHDSCEKQGPILHFKGCFE